MVTSFNTKMTSRIDAAVRFFYLSHRLVLVYEIELSHMGKNNGNPDLMCEKKIAETPYWCARIYEP